MQVSKLDWIEAGLELVGWVGVSGIKITDLARRLGVTKGSFYWHFKDRDDYLESIVQAWEEDSRALFARVDAEPDPHKRLGVMLDLVTERVGHRKGRLPDHAMFTWAHHDRKIARRVALVEQERLDVLTRLGRDLGFSRGEAESRMLIMYLAAASWLERENRCPELLPRYDIFARQMNDLLLTSPLKPASGPPEPATRVAGAGPDDRAGSGGAATPARAAARKAARRRG